MDNFEHDLRQEPERLEAECWPLDGGGTYWPHLVFAQPDGFRPLMLDLRVPRSEGPRPLVVYIHGGGWAIGTPKYDNPTLRQLEVPARLIAAGYAVARVSYRLFGEARWPVQLHDCKAAVRWLRAKGAGFGLDPDRVAVMGESAGGHLATMVGLTGDDPALEGDVGTTGPSSAVRAVVNWYGVTDLWAIGEGRGDGPRLEERLIGASRATSRDALTAASPVAHVRPGAPAFLHQHGDRDRLVPLSQAEALHAALVEAGVPSELDVISGADHCFWGANAPTIMDRVISFLDRRL